MPLRRFWGFIALSGFVLVLGSGVAFGFDGAFALNERLSLRDLLSKENLSSLQDVEEAFLDVYGKDPSGWPKDLRKIHHIAASWAQRVLLSENFAAVLEDDERKRLRLLIESPVDYWAWVIWSGSWPNAKSGASHLSAREVPPPLLERYMQEIFPITWIDLNQAAREMEYMLGKDDAGFVPGPSSDNDLIEERKKDIKEYNSSLKEAAKKYAEAKDLPMLALLSGRSDASWLGGDEFQSVISGQVKEIENEIEGAFEAERNHLFRSIFGKVEPFSINWMEGKNIERHLFLDFKAEVPGTSQRTLTAGLDIRLVHRNPWTEGGNDAPLVEKRPALFLEWRDFPFNGLLSEEPAELILKSRDFLLVRLYNGGEGAALALFPGGVSRTGLMLEIKPSRGNDLPAEVFGELFKRFEKAFCLAAEERYGSQKDDGDVPKSREASSVVSARSLSSSVSGFIELEKEGALRNTCWINVELTERDQPVPGAELAVERPRLGRLYSPMATGVDENTLYIATDPAGKAFIAYEAPRVEEIESNFDELITFGIRDNASGSHEKVQLWIVRPSFLEASAQHDLIPGEDSFPNVIHFRFFGGRLPSDSDKYEVVVRSTSGFGLLSDKGTNWTGSPLKISGEPGAWQSLLYRWGGPLPEIAPVEETVVVEVPGLNLYETVNFRVGAMPVVSEIEAEKEQSEFPGTYVPLKVTITDKLNPETDLEGFLESFGLSPVVEIEPVDYTPFPLAEEDEGLLEKLLETLPGVTLQEEPATFQPESWLLAKEEGPVWVLAGEYPYRSSGKRRAGSNLPGFIPPLWGDYTFRIRLAFEGKDGRSALPFGRTETRVLSFRPEDEKEMAKTRGVMPLVMLYSSMFPGENARFVILKAKRLVSEGKHADLAVILGDAFSRSLAVNERLSYEGETGRLREMAAAAEGVAIKDLPEEKFLRMVENAKLYFLCQLGGAYMDSLAGLASTGDDGEEHLRARFEKEKRLQEILQGFLYGFGDYGLAAVSKEGLKRLSVYDEQGFRLSECPPVVFSPGGHNERLYAGENAVVIVFRLGENLVLDVSGTGPPIQAIKVLPNGINKTLCCEDKTTERLTLFGDVVVPEKQKALR